MITRLYRSKSDIENLSRLKTSFPIGKDRYDYKKFVVNKPWGYEYLLFENTDVSIWMLYVGHDQSTSMHCHPRKKTTLIVVRGETICSTIEGFNHLKRGDGLIIEPGVFHTTRAVSQGGSLVMEIETPPNKRDLVRLKDMYGRERKGYEGTAQWSTDLDKYEYVDFHGAAPNKRKTRNLGACILSLNVHKGKGSVGRKIFREKAEVLCLLSGNLHDKHGNTFLMAGEAITIQDLKRISHVSAFRAIMYLTLRYAQGKPSASKIRGKTTRGVKGKRHGKKH